MNLEENIIDDSVLIKALSSLKEVSSPESLLRDAIAEARKREGRPVYKQSAKGKKKISWQYLSAAAALVICLGLSYAALSGIFNGNTAKGGSSVAEKAEGAVVASNTASADNKSTDNALPGDFAATTSLSDSANLISDSSTAELKSSALYENRDELIAALSDIPTCGIRTDELSDDIVIYSDNALYIIDILKSYIYDLNDEQGTAKPIDELSGIITIKVEFE